MRPLAALLVLSMLAAPAAAQLIPDGATPEKVADGYRFTEGPAAGPDGCIYFTDIPAELILKYDPQTGETETFLEESGQANGLMWHEGNLYMCCHGTRAVMFYRANEQSPEVDRRSIPGEFSRTTNHVGQINTILDHWSFVTDAVEKEFETVRLNSPNDIAIDDQGNFYFTDPRYGNRDSMETQIEGVYYSGTTIRDIDGQDYTMSVYREIDKTLTRPNGIVLSPDELILYVADNGTNEIFAYDVAEPLGSQNKRLFARLNDGEGGGPDGMCVDAQGRVYAAGQGKVWIYNPDGSAAGVIEVGRACTNCTFAADGKTLYITANHGLYRIELNTDEPLPGEDDE